MERPLFWTKRHCVDTIVPQHEGYWGKKTLSEPKGTPVLENTYLKGDNNKIGLNDPRVA